jgi:Tfp pilus assembly protein PilF
MWLFLVHQMGHGAPGFFHLGLILMHLVVMLEIYLLGRRLTGDAVTGALAALLFGIHPTHIESVAWISGISDVLSAAFFLAALLAYLRWVDGDGGLWLGLSLVCLEAALLSKEAAALLVVLIVLDRFRQFRSMDLFSRTVHAMYVSLPFIAITALHFAWHSYVLAQRSVWVEGQSLAPSFAVAPYVLWWYLKKQVVAVPVSINYPTVHAGGLTAAQIGVSSLVGIVVLGVAWTVVRHSRAGQLLVALFGLTLLPVVLGAETLQLHDRYLYLPGVALALGAAVLLRRAPWLSENPRAQFAIVLAIVVIMVPLSYVETSYWSNDVRLFEHSLQSEPGNIDTMELLFSAYECSGDHVHAEQILRRTVAEFPKIPRLWTRLAMFCLGHGYLDEAESCARKALSMTPASKSFPAAFDVLGQVALRRGNLADAELWAKRAVAADGSRPASHLTLATVYGVEGRTAQAIAESRLAAAKGATDPSKKR